MRNGEVLGNTSLAFRIRIKLLYYMYSSTVQKDIGRDTFYCIIMEMKSQLFSHSVLYMKHHEREHGLIAQ